MDKLVKKITIMIIGFSFFGCDNESISNTENSQDSVPATYIASGDDDQDNLTQHQIDSIIILFNSMPVLEFKNSLSSGLIRKEKRGKLIYDNGSWKVLYEDYSSENPDAYENATVDLSKMSVKYGYSMDVYQVNFFYSSQRGKLMAITVLSDNYTSGIPSDILFIHEIDDENNWTEISQNLFPKEEIIEKFIPGLQYVDIFNDLFNIKISHPSKLIIYPNFFYLKNLDSSMYRTHPIFQIDKSMINDSVGCIWNDSQGRFEMNN